MTKLSGRMALALGMALLVTGSSMAPAHAWGGVGVTPSVGAAVSDQDAASVGPALRDVSRVRDAYRSRIQAATTREQKRALTEEENAAEVQAIKARGVSLEEYGRVTRLAQQDPQVMKRLLAAGGDRR